MDSLVAGEANVTLAQAFDDIIIGIVFRAFAAVGAGGASRAGAAGTGMHTGGEADKGSEEDEIF